MKLATGNDGSYIKKEKVNPASGCLPVLIFKFLSFLRFIKCYLFP